MGQAWVGLLQVIFGYSRNSSFLVRRMASVPAGVASWGAWLRATANASGKCDRVTRKTRDASVL